MSFVNDDDDDDDDDQDSSWLDDEARKPFAVGRDVQDGFTNICGACQSLFKREYILYKVQKHFRIL